VKRAGAAAILALLGSCGAEESRSISEWGPLFTDVASQTPAPGVVPYDVIAPLFSDYASKHRFIRLPEGGRITVAADGSWEMPVGTVIVKTFGFLRDLRDPSLGERIVETRLLVREEAGWEPYVYVWNDALTDAELAPAGRRVPVELVDLAGTTRSFTYRVPNHTQCGNCHGGGEPTHLLGVRTDQLDHDGQVEAFVAMGMLDAMPPPLPQLIDPEDTTEPLEARARSYMHANCAHCHRQDGAAHQSGLWLTIEETDPVRLGRCKLPIAAGSGSGGRPVVVWPGDPMQSILNYRVESDEPGIKMPELPTILVHEEGAALLREWVAAMPPFACVSP
jgi:uncharacterized repeat protein (TIGR03806 family)